MTSFKRFTALAMILCSFSLFAAPASTYAANTYEPFSEVCKNGGANSAVCKDQTNSAGQDPVAGEDGVIMKVVNLVAVIGGVAAVIIIILAGLRFVTSGGSSEGVAGARSTMIYAAVGLAIIVLARVIIGFVIGNI